MKVSVTSLLVTVALGVVAASPSRRIVGGQFANDAKQFPYQVALFDQDEFRCGGSIIAEQWILTAAHCISEEDYSATPTEHLTILVGTHHLKEGGKKVKPVKVIPHSGWARQGYDIGLIKLEEALVFDDTMQKLELYRGELPVNQTVTISGHGKTGQNEPISEVLKFNTMTVMSEWACFNKIQYTRWKKIICLNNAVNNGVCTGDSGSAAVYEGKQIGVCNFVLGKCGSASPDGYAIVPFFVDWIEKTMNE